MLMAGGSLVAGSDKPHFGTLMPLGPSTPSFLVWKLGLAGSRDRGEADRARAILLTLSGWTSPRIAEAFSVREDTVRLWRSDFSRGGTEALKASVAPGPSPVKSETALRVLTPLLEEPVANRPNWTIARMRAEIEAVRACASAARNCPRRCEKKFRYRRPRHTLKGRQIASEVDRIGLRLQLLEQQAEAGDIVLPLWRRERGVDASLSRQSVGKIRC
jgi:transposase